MYPTLDRILPWYHLPVDTYFLPHYHKSIPCWHTSCDMTYIISLWYVWLHVNMAFLHSGTYALMLTWYFLIMVQLLLHVNMVFPHYGISALMLTLYFLIIVCLLSCWHTSCLDMMHLLSCWHDTSSLWYVCPHADMTLYLSSRYIYPHADIPRTFRRKCLLTSPASLEARQVYLPESSILATRSWRTIPWELIIMWSFSPKGWLSLSQVRWGTGLPSTKQVIEVELPLTIVISSVSIALSILGGTIIKSEVGKLRHLLSCKIDFRGSIHSCSVSIINVNIKYK